MDKIDALKRLDQALQGNRQLIAGEQPAPEFNKWRRDTRVAIERIFGEDSRHVKEFEGVSFTPWAVSASSAKSVFEDAKIRGLKSSEQLLRSMRDEILDYWPNAAEMVKQGPVGTPSPVAAQSDKQEPIEIESIPVSRLFMMLSHLTLGSLAMLLGALAFLVSATWGLARWVERDRVDAQLQHLEALVQHRDSQLTVLRRNAVRQAGQTNADLNQDTVRADSAYSDSSRTEKK